jgi:hypothetical protein
MSRACCGACWSTRTYTRISECGFTARSLQCCGTWASQLGPFHERPVLLPRLLISLA